VDKGGCTTIEQIWEIGSQLNCAWNLQSTYTQAILKMTQFLVLKYTSTYA